MLANNSGVFNANADVSLDNASAYDTGIINLNTGTLSAFRGLSFFGVDSVTRSAGSYSTSSLSLWDGATLGYGSGDSITSSVYIASGAALTLAKDLNLSGYITVEDAATTLTLAGHALSVDSLLVSRNASVTLDQNLTFNYLELVNGGSITRTSETISALRFTVDNAALDLLAGDTFSPGDSSYVRNGALVNAPAGTSIGYLNVYGTNGNGDRATFNANGDVSLVNASASSAGVINLNTGTFSASQGLSFDGVGSVTRSGGSYSTNSLTLSNGVTLGYDAGDTINNAVSLASGAALTLAKDLNLSGAITVDGAATSLISTGHALSASSLSVNHGAAVTLDQNLTLSNYLYLQNGGSITRTSETISALGFYVEDAALDLLAGDTFSPGDSSYVRNGALVNAPAGTALGLLNVFGTNGNGDRATFNANGSITLTSAAVSSNGVLNLIAGTLSTPNLSLSGVGSAGQSGGHYDVTNLSLYGGATLSFGLGDSIDSLSIMDAGSRLDELAPLTLTSLSLTNGGILHLGAFTGTGAIANWGLRMTGDDTSFLQGLIGGGLLNAGLSPLSVIFDAGSNMTYVTLVSAPVPEIDPNTAHGAVMLLVGAAGILERRLRRVALVRRAS
ncbi:MAG: hypothetical protein NT171_19275 [Planctomycetota bacterium]|nr:hypothetical protein [Planctomycetota bacterium]